MGKDYTCSRCGGHFTSDWSEEQAIQEAIEVFGPAIVSSVGLENASTVCEDCYKEVIITPEEIEAIKEYILSQQDKQN